MALKERDATPSAWSAWKSSSDSSGVYADKLDMWVGVGRRGEQTTGFGWSQRDRPKSCYTASQARGCVYAQCMLLRCIG